MQIQQLYPAIKRFRTGGSLTQAILSSQEAADFLFFLMRLIQRRVSVRQCLHGNHLLLYRRGLDARYGPGTADALEERYPECHFKGKTTKEWSKREYEAKIENQRESGCPVRTE
jgi:hypothetical protein